MAVFLYMNTNKMLTGIGNVGAGKSSALEIVSKCLEAKSIDADNLFQTSDPFAKEFLKDTSRWALANELWLTNQRANLLRDELTKSKNQWLVVDSGLLMSWVYTYSHLLVGKMSLEEWELYEELFDKLSQGLESEVVLWLDYSLPTLLKRINKRGRDYEMEFYTKEYVEQLQLGIDALVERLVKTNVKLLGISEDEVADFVVNPRDKYTFKSAVNNYFK